MTQANEVVDPADRFRKSLPQQPDLGHTHGMDVSYREIGGVRTRVLTVTGRGEPILLLHGFSDHASGWRPFLKVMEEQGRTAIAVDMPGFGRADQLQPGLVMPQIATFVAGVVRMVAAEHGSPLLVGNSLGGAAAWAAAQESRLPLAGLVAVAPAGFGFSPSLRVISSVVGVVPPPLLVPPIPLPLLRHLLLRGYARGAGPGRQLDPAVGRAWLGQFARRRDVRRSVALVERVLAELDDFRALAVPAYPVLMVWGSRDRLVRSGAPLPGTEAIHVEGWGHCPQLDHAEELAQLVLEFGDRLPAGQERSA
jgi:pimeloyl-ACP methyl ester carboxylesterase